MLNYNDATIQKLVTGALSAHEARTKISAAYHKALSALRNDGLWEANLPAMMTVTASFTNLLGDKLLQALKADRTVADDFASRLWFDVTMADVDHSAITFHLASADHNQDLLTIDTPLGDSAKLVAKSLPTLIQVTATEPVLDYTDSEVTALSAMIKVLYTADLAFARIDETVLQPVDGLTFKTRYDNTQVRTATATARTAGDLTLTLPLTEGVVLGYRVRDNSGSDWTNLGTADTTATAFTWTSNTIPENLVGHSLKLEAQVRTGENSPALDELFVIASSNAILMRQGSNLGDYALDLPNHKTLAINVDPEEDTLTLAYPEPTVQVLELNHTYPFLGDWLKAILPMRRAFN
ncbi:hypothetical protein [Lacticaseibacillus daqingensis]|uniref:hypothetical protein n=1 Tax=Lacticaseibacillus daqingensis TaxID=2486014 RepID=UPI000F799CD7|nr:hypothetical protein [Lacticaseibacillus daqingensis]